MSEGGQLYIFLLEKGVKYKIFPNRYLLRFEKNSIFIHDLSHFTVLYQEEDRMILKTNGSIKHMQTLQTLRDKNERSFDQVVLSPLEIYFYDLDLETVQKICKMSDETDAPKCRMDATNMNKSKECKHKNKHNIKSVYKTTNESACGICRKSQKENTLFCSFDSQAEKKNSGTVGHGSKNREGSEFRASNHEKHDIEELDETDPQDEPADLVSLESLLKSLSADPDIERAINKSLYLSKGKVLDTNWTRVGNKEDWEIEDKKNEKKEDE